MKSESDCEDNTRAKGLCGLESGDNTGGFIDHGVAMPLSQAAATAVTKDGSGRDCVLMWLSDSRGSYAVAMVDAETGASREVPRPFAHFGYTLNALLARSGKYYAHFGNRFLEFDPISETFTFVGDMRSVRAICLTEDDKGVIYSVGHPDSGLVSYNPATGCFRDHGIMNPSNALHYHGYMAADDAGWVYCAVDETHSQIIAFDPSSGKAFPLLPEEARVPNICAYVHRGVDGKVYGVTSVHGWSSTGWYAIHRGKALAIGKAPEVAAVERGEQTFPDGKKLKKVDMWDRTLLIADPTTGTEKTVPFVYTSDGALVMSVAVAPDKTIWGWAHGYFGFQPYLSSWDRHTILGQWNCVLNAGELCYIGSYTRGYLQEWDCAKPWVSTEVGKEDCNPRVVVECYPDIDRPHCLILHRGTNTVIMGGIPGYGYTGGGLLFFGRATGQHTMVKHESILPWHATMSLAELPDGRVLGGTTTRAGTGGEQKAPEAELYIMDIVGKTIEWRGVVFPGAQEITELAPGPRGLVYGLTSFQTFDPERLLEAKLFFVFDPKTRTVVYQMDASETFGHFCYQQGPRKIMRHEDGRSFLLFQRCVAEIDPVSFTLKKVADVPIDIFSGGDMLGDRIYFSDGSRLCSCHV